jgi:hypothetical protein
MRKRTLLAVVQHPRIAGKTCDWSEELQPSVQLVMHGGFGIGAVVPGFGYESGRKECMSQSRENSTRRTHLQAHCPVLSLPPRLVTCRYATSTLLMRADAYQRVCLYSPREWLRTLSVRSACVDSRVSVGIRVVSHPSPEGISRGCKSEHRKERDSQQSHP